MDVKFVSYDGKYPCLCCGTLVLLVNEEKFVFKKYSLVSGGYVSFDENWIECIEEGPWSIDEWPKAFPAEAKGKALKVVNENVPWGCCGGCI